MWITAVVDRLKMIVKPMVVVVVIIERQAMCQNQPDKALKMLHWQACGAEHLGDRCQTGCAHLCSCVDRVFVRGEEMDDDDDD